MENANRILPDIAGKYAETGRYQQALEIAKTIDDDYEKARALTYIGSAYVEAGQKVDDRARKILRDILKELEYESDI
jgi:hypothetical protein